MNPGTPHEPDQDVTKGAVEDGPATHGNANADVADLDDQGRPRNPVAIAEDVIGANEDQTQG
jgi:hypothetical protein